ncbi:MAG: AMP-binding protein, partial [Burkholderiales bacterium]|nr:AMP-binding protein [Burkholderiales bacterium]
LSGDWIPLALPDKLKAAFPDVCVVALGGATEATIWSNYYIVQQVQSEWVSIPYGRPIQNARYYILDSALQAVPVGVAGDLYIGGDCLAEGYVGEPQLTAERFIPDPYAPPGTQGARMYRTGDRAKFFPDGVMEFLGRLDNQVKIRGFRVELGDIEVAMNRHPAIKDAICIVYDPSTSGPASGQSDKELIGYFVLQHGENLSTEAYQQYLAKNLPVNMLPSFLIRLDSLPVSVNGKVDRKNLPLPERKNAQNFSVHSNKDALQDIVAAAWCEVLGIEHVHSGDDFFSLGGHSLRATSVMARLRVAIGIDLPLRLIFEHTTLHALSAAIRNLATGDANGQELSLPIVDRTQGVRLSRAQSRLYFLHQLERDSANYNVALAAKLTGDVDLNAFSLAAQQVISRHEIFNLRISHSGELAMLMLVDTDIASVLNMDDLRHLYLDETQILGRIKELACIPFDLEQQRPLRINLLRTDDQQVFVLIVMHHIATDGWSIALFAEELLAAYDAVRQPLPAIPDMVPALQYADFSAWHEQLVEEKYQAPEMLYWKQQLANLPRLHLPTDFPRQAPSLYAGARISFVLDEQLSVMLRRVARQQSVTLFMLMLTAFEVVLRHRSGQDEIVVGTDIAGRDHPLAEKIQGFFVNQLVLRTHYSACASFSDMLEQVRQSCLQAYFHQHLPFDALVQELNPSRDAGGMPLFQHKFVLQNAPLAQMQSQHFSIHPIDLHTDTAKYDLLLTVLDESPMRATLEFSTELFTQATAENMVREFSDVLKQVAADCTVSYASLSAMLDAEGEARQNLARRDLRKSGLQRLKELRKPGSANV